MSVLDIHGSFLAFMQASKRAGATSISGLVPEEKKRAVRSGFHHPAGVKRKVRSGGSARSLVLISKFSPSCRVCLVSMNSAWRGACALGRQQACPGNSGHNLRAVFIIMKAFMMKKGRVWWTGWFSSGWTGWFSSGWTGGLACPWGQAALCPHVCRPGNRAGDLLDFYLMCQSVYEWRRSDLNR